MRRTEEIKERDGERRMRMQGMGARERYEERRKRMRM
jgi:hypothetical protein